MVLKVNEEYPAQCMDIEKIELLEVMPMLKTLDTWSGMKIAEAKLRGMVFTEEDLGKTTE